MAISPELQYATLNEFYLDAKNPRLSRHYVNADSSQEEILEVMNRWDIYELAASYLENGFWTHEALLVLKEELNGHHRLVVVDGNRRLAALIYLHRAMNGEKVSKKWYRLIGDTKIPKKIFNYIPYILIDSRQEVEAFLGFHHNVTGIKHWIPEQKAQYITQLIDECGMRYEEVVRKIGSNASNKVQEYYISCRLLLQMEECLEDFSLEDTKFRFSILYLSLRIPSVQKYLGLDISSDPQVVRTPVPKTHLNALGNFARWLFGTQQQSPLFINSQYLDDFGMILGSPKAVQYLENNEDPNFDHARQLSSAGEAYAAELLREASANIQNTLMSVHHYKDSQAVQFAAERLAINVKELLDQYPNLRSKFLE
ncbi:hypothetical protein C6496_14305 [Candidatus Poribacteria bacterium]|nr:MAG: hypothetical protein C6496_14305 [Candidatus Poribacteria bacterium]